MNRTYVITGVAGFIGSEIARLLLENNQTVIGIDDMSFGYQDNLDPLLKYEQFRFIKSSILDIDPPSYLKGVDYVLHFAGISSLPECESDPVRAYKVNVLGTLKILNGVRLSKVQRFFFASTSAVYENSTLKPFTEDIQVIPDLIYSQSKLASEYICHSFRENYGIDVVIGRFFNVYGPHQDFRRPNPPFTSYLIREIMHNRIPTLFNDGEYKRDYIYIDDLTRLVLGLLHKPNLKYLTYNLTSGDAFSPKQIVNLVRGILGVDIQYQVGSVMDYWSAYPSLSQMPNPFAISRIIREIEKVSIGSNSRVCDELGIQNFKSMHDGLQEIIKFQQPNDL